MKTIITSILIAISVASSAQCNNIGSSNNGYAREYIWAIVPDTVCPGDTVKVYFKFEYPGVAPTHTITQFQWSWDLSYVWQGDYNTFYSLPCEKCFACNPPDSMRTIKFKVPYSAPPYQQKIYPNINNVSFWVKNNCTTNIKEQQESNNQKSVYFDIWGNPSEKKSGVLLIEQTGPARRKVVFN